jgi:HlyD family secretion protein
MGDEFKQKIDSFLKPNKRIPIVLSIAGMILVGAAAIYSINTTGKKNTQPQTQIQIQQPKKIAKKIEAVTALGRLEPSGEIIIVSPPPDMGGSKIARSFVEEGDTVKANQTIAILDNQPTKQATVNVAKQDVKVAKAELEIVKAGAKTGEIKAQKATIGRWQAELTRTKEERMAAIERAKAEFNNAEVEYGRYQQLANDGGTSLSELDKRGLTLETARKKLIEAEANYNKTVDTVTQQIEEAKANLNRIAEIRPVDINKAQANLDKAIASLQQAEQDLQLTYIKAPINGQILKINARPGEMVKQDDGVLQMGQTDRMMVVAEVYESDISKVKIGQKAIVTSESGSFTKKLKGKVSHVGLKIGKNDVLNTDPAADTDTRVVEVKILLDPADSKVVSGLTYSKVTVKIQR